MTLSDQIQEAKHELDLAWNHFDNAASEYFEVANARVEAAEKRYNQLIRELRAEGLQAKGLQEAV